MSQEQQEQEEQPPPKSIKTMEFETEDQALFSFVMQCDCQYFRTKKNQA